MLKIESERLFLRPFQESDCEALEKVLSDPIVMQYSVTGPCSRQEILDFIHRNMRNMEQYKIALLALIHKEKGSLIGICGIYWADLEGEIVPELGYRLAKEEWGKGYALEAAKGVLDYVAATFKFPKLISIIEPDNERSIKLAKKLGAYFLKTTLFKGIPVRIYAYPK